MLGPNPMEIFPNKHIKSICYIKNTVKNPNIEIGDYTYYSDNVDATNFEKHVTHFYDFSRDKLVIGKFCAIGQGVEFVMNDSNHRMSSVSTYPFNIMGNGWEKATPSEDDLTFKGDTVVGNDVWIGQNVTIMPGVKIGDGAIIGANSTVAKDVEPYTIVAGNPIRLIRKRFCDNIIERLLKVQWWNWDDKKIFENLDILCSKNIERIFDI